MLHNQSQTHARPYWHVDAKWLTGIAFFVALWAALFTYNLTNVTTRETVVPLSATIIAGLFSEKGLNDESSVTEFRQMAAKSPGDTITPIPQFPTVHLTKEQAMTLSAKDLRLAIFSQITGPIYDKGLKAAASEFIPDAKDQQTFTSQASLLGIVTGSTHDLLQKAFIFTSIMALIFAALMIFFSAGWGRLVSPGVVLLAASPVGSILALGLHFMSKDGSSSITSAVPAGVVTTLSDSLSHSYLYATIAGVTLLVAAGIGKLATTIMSHSKHATAPIVKEQSESAV